MIRLHHLLIAALTLAASYAAAQPTRIGAAAAVAGAVKAEAPGAVGRVIQSGQPLFLNDHVTTDASGRLQVMLLDETVFTIGPNSDMVLDEFVYDPASGSGKIAASVTKGVFRFVTGKVARKNPASMKVKLPVGTIGIRGTMAGGTASPEACTAILLGPGESNNAGEAPGAIAAQNQDAEVVITRPGYGSTMVPGQPPSPPADMSQQAAQIAAQLEPEPQPSQQKPEGEGQSSAAEESGQATAAATQSLGETREDSQLAEALGEDLAFANNRLGGVPDGNATFDHLRSVESGTGFYDDRGGSTYFCTGGACAAGSSGELHFHFLIDFGARTFGGGSSQSHAYLNTGALAGEESLISQTSFASLQGNAKVVFDASNSSSSKFYGSSFQFVNRDGVPARDAVFDLKFTGLDAEQGSGTATATRNP